MEKKIGSTVVKLVQGDITDQKTDAIVTAANSGLRGGGGVDGAIHKKAGPRLLDECREIGMCPTGSAVITGAGNLPARHVIHAVGPVWSGGTREEEEKLAGAYRTSLELADKHDCKSIAFPSISTGIYGYPADKAAETAMKTVTAYIKGVETKLKEIVFVLFDDKTFDHYRKALIRITSQNREQES